jgi:hypothetical protein
LVHIVILATFMTGGLRLGKLDLRLQAQNMSLYPINLL